MTRQKQDVRCSFGGTFSQSFRQAPANLAFVDHGIVLVACTSINYGRLRSFPLASDRLVLFVTDIVCRDTLSLKHEKQW